MWEQINGILSTMVPGSVWRKSMEGKRVGAYAVDVKLIHCSQIRILPISPLANSVEY